jgi:hypothetical protein
MNFGVYRQYFLYQSDGLVPKIECGNDKTHLNVVPNLDSDDKVFLYCLECNYKKYPGLEFYKKLLKIVERLENGGTQG